MNLVLTAVLLSVVFSPFVLTAQETDPPAAKAAVSKPDDAKESKTGWQVDFLDNFDKFDPENWQDQMIWVNNEMQCYVPDNQHGTREVSNGTLKLKVVNVDSKQACDNCDKHGKKHPDTRYVAGRICSKNRKEFVKGKWTARLKTWGHGKPSMFPAWWILGAQNNEPPVQEADENIPWPMTGSGEIDIFEHHGDGGPGHFTTGAIKSLGEPDKGDWQSLRKGVETNLDEFHDYSVEWAGSDLVYRVDGVEVHRNVGEGDKYPEAMFAILNYAKITDSPMTGEWVMEVDWVKHESWNDKFKLVDPQPPMNLKLEQNESKVSLSWDTISGDDVSYSVYRSDRSGKKTECVAKGLKGNRFEEKVKSQDQAYYYSVSSKVGSLESRPGKVVHTALPFVLLPARIEAEDYVAMSGIATENCGDEGGGQNLGFFEPNDFMEYNIRVATAGEFTIDYRLASQSGSEGFEVLIDDKVVDRQTVVATGGWQSYINKTSSRFSVSEGKHKLRFRSIGNEWNINWFEFKQP